MHILTPNNLLDYQKNLQFYRKIDCPYPKGIIFVNNHLWNKERYLSPYHFEHKKNHNQYNRGICLQ